MKRTPIRSTDCEEAWKDERHAGMREALKARVRASRAPTDDDCPPPTVLPRAEDRPIVGQLDLEGNEVGAPPTSRNRRGRRPAA